VIAPLLPNKPRRAPRVDYRYLFNGIFWVLRDGRTMALAADGIRIAYDLLQLESRGSRPHQRRRQPGPGWWRADDRQHFGAPSSACRQLKKATRIAVWAARAGADVTTEIHPMTDTRPALGTGGDAGPGRRLPGCRQPARASARGCHRAGGQGLRFRLAAPPDSQ
jgi:hypothetical protein